LHPLVSRAYADRNAATAINHMSNYFFVYHRDIFSIRPSLSLEICPLITDALRTRPSDNEILSVDLLGLNSFFTILILCDIDQRRATWYELWLHGHERRKAAWAGALLCQIPRTKQFNTTCD